MRRSELFLNDKDMSFENIEEIHKEINIEDDELV
jgi:hypothetical protein